MKALFLAGLMLAVAISGCVDPVDEEQPDFDISCPLHITANNLHPRWRNEGMVYDVDGQTDAIRETEQRDKWIVEPTIQGGYEYRGGRLEYIDVEITVDGIMDGYLYFEAYRASDDEPAATPQGEQPMAPTGDRLLWQDVSKGPRSERFSRVEIGPYHGVEDEDIQHWINGTYRIAFPEGTDPSRVRIDAFFEVQDDTTDSAAVFTATASFWWLHADCL